MDIYNTPFALPLEIKAYLMEDALMAEASNDLNFAFFVMMIPNVDVFFG